MDIWADDSHRQFLTGDGTAGASGGVFRLNFGLLAGDYAGNGYVDGSDYLLYQQLLGAGWSAADGNGDGATNGGDGTVWTNNFGNFLAMNAIAFPADLIDDDRIDSKDLAVWKAAFALTGNGDITGDGVTDGADFLLWQQLVGAHTAWDPNLSVISASATVIGDFAPRIAKVIISGSHSTHAAFAFDVVDGSGRQLATVPVGGADTISIVFSEDVNVSAGSLLVVGLRTATLPTLAEFAYNAATHTAVWRFEGWALADQYALSLADAITDVDGNWLDGEWTNPNRIYQTGGSGAYFQNAAISEFPSGDGAPGGAFNFVMTLMPGDANLDGVIQALDFSILSANYGGAINKIFSQGDFNGDGAVNGADFSILQDTFNLNMQTLQIWADFNGDFKVNDDDLMIIANNAGMTGAAWADGDLNGDGEVTMEDLDLALAQFGAGGLFLSVVS